MRKLLLLTTVILATGCGKSFEPASYVDKLRILAIRADPPEIATGGDEAAPPDAAELGTLLADPAQLDDDARQATVLYLACTPDPLDPYGSACASIEMIASPEGLRELLASGAAGSGSCDEGTGGAPGAPRGPAVELAGVEVCEHGAGCVPPTLDLGAGPMQLPPPGYRIPEGFDLAGLPEGHPARIKGAQAIVLAVALAAAPEELITGDPSDPCTFFPAVAERLGQLLGERESVTALKRIQIRGPDAKDDFNVNPGVPGILSAGKELPAELTGDIPAAARFTPGKERALLPILPSDPDGEPIPEDVLFQAFTRYDAAGAFVESDREEWLYSWFATAGSFEEERTRGHDKEQRWKAPDGSENEPIRSDGRVFLYAVVRDTRGGIDWAVREVRIER